MVSLIITADDYGYHPAYDEGILEAARAGAIDSVSAFSTRPGLEPEPLLESGVEVGLHLDLGEPGDASRAGDGERDDARAEVERQLEAFEAAFGKQPAYLDGHHHCHAREGLGVVVANIAAARELPVRSVNPRQRRILKCRGIPTSGLTVGRSEESRPAMPAELQMGVGSLPAVVEWFVHPGHTAGDGFSRYDAGREQDLRLLLRFRPPRGVRRRTHAAAFAAKR